MSIHNQHGNRRGGKKFVNKQPAPKKIFTADKAGAHEKIPKDQRTKSRDSRGGAYFLYGRHPAEAAIANPHRRIKGLWLTKPDSLTGLPAGIAVHQVSPDELGALLPEGAVHQGIALEVFPLEACTLDDLVRKGRPIIILDQVTDPHNVGAILRSAAAFDAGGIIVTKHHSPDETGVLAKSASGALEIVPIVAVPNLSNILEYLKKNGYWCAGLDGGATQTLAEAKLTAKTALVMGAEGAGLRRLTAENCDLLVKLPMPGKMESLNVSNAAAIALYELNR
jgi:23S rRNA (guanosine2251-2'-O)-methyltransferase